MDKEDKPNVTLSWRLPVPDIFGNEWVTGVGMTEDQAKESLKRNLQTIIDNANDALNLYSNFLKAIS